MGKNENNWVGAVGFLVEGAFLQHCRHRPSSAPSELLPWGLPGLAGASGAELRQAHQGRRPAGLSSGGQALVVAAQSAGGAGSRQRALVSMLWGSACSGYWHSRGWLSLSEAN